MALATLVMKGGQRLRYLLTSATPNIDSVVISTVGGPSPDILTDSAGTNGNLKAIAKAFSEGYGPFPAGPFTQAGAQALWMSNTPADPDNQLTPLALCVITPRTGVALWMVDANVDGGGHPLIVVGKTNQNGGLGPFGATDSAYLDVFIPGTIGV